MMALAQQTPPPANGIRARFRHREFGLVAAYLLTIAVILVVTVYPMVWLIIGSLSEKDGGYGISNYVKLNQQFSGGSILVNSWIYAFGSAALATATGVLLAVLVARTDVRFKRIARLSAVLTFVSPPWLTAMAYVYIASPNAGFVNQLMDRLVGVKPFDIQSMTGMIFVTALFLYSFVFLTVEAALASVDGSFEEAPGSPARVR